ncbi:hypothetical protein ACFX5Q_19035 [Mesorhizobium sp. IMUNJ 23033]|uniref:hypothetical protein n=1 Tax=Mesorhizobium sp. IMUNJ 23033 TaxID=3378039 RepID=UPI00384B1769
MTTATDLDDITIDLDHLATLLHVLADMALDASDTASPASMRISALSAIARDMADRNTEAVEQYHRTQIEAGKRLAAA